MSKMIAMFVRRNSKLVRQTMRENFVCLFVCTMFVRRNSKLRQTMRENFAAAEDVVAKAGRERERERDGGELPFEVQLRAGGPQNASL